MAGRKNRANLKYSWIRFFGSFLAKHFKQHAQWCGPRNRESWQNKVPPMI